MYSVYSQYVCISSLLVSCYVPLVSCSVLLPVERYHDCQGVSGRSTLCDCSLLVDCFLACSLFKDYTTLKHTS